MLKKTIIDLLNQQVNKEQFASTLYLQMAAWCDHKGYVGCAKFLKGHAKEELMHMNKLFEYLTETGNLPILAAVPAPANEWSDLKNVFVKILENEREISDSINKILAKTLAEQDFSTFNFLQWFLTEQHEEEHLFQSILDKMDVIGIDGKGIYFFDKEIGKIAPSV